ncbi:hypothetical protein GW17_00044072, partial [Ensete ventricosum]
VDGHAPVEVGSHDSEGKKQLEIKRAVKAALISPPASKMVKHTVTNFEAATLPFSSCYSCLGCRGKIIPPWIRVKTDGFAVSEAGVGANARGGSVLKIARGSRTRSICSKRALAARGGEVSTGSKGSGWPFSPRWGQIDGVHLAAVVARPTTPGRCRTIGAGSRGEQIQQQKAE